VRRRARRENGCQGGAQAQAERRYLGMFGRIDFQAARSHQIGKRARYTRLSSIISSEYFFCGVAPRQLVQRQQNNNKQTQSTNHHTSTIKFNRLQ
jgi:hypothetical protein